MHSHLPIHYIFFFSTRPRPPISTLFPYTTLFRSRHQIGVPQRSPGKRPKLTSDDRLLKALFCAAAWIRLALDRSEEHTSELQSPDHLVCRLLLEKKKKTQYSRVFAILYYDVIIRV